MDKKRIKKIMLLSMLSSMLLTGCTKKQQEEPTAMVITESTTQEQEEAASEVISNETLEEILKEYNEQTQDNINISDLYIKEYYKDIKYLSQKGEEYIYDYRINGYNNQGYTNIDPGYNGKMYAVVLHNDEKYETICALAKINGRIFNVKVTILDINKETHEASDNYIYIDPTQENFDNLKDGQDYIDNYTNNESKNIYILKNNYFA